MLDLVVGVVTKKIKSRLQRLVCVNSGGYGRTADRKPGWPIWQGRRRARRRPFTSKNAFEDEHPAAGDQMLQVVRQALDPFLRLLLPALEVDDLRDQHVIG